jgi:hypothetical protein
MQIFAVLHRSPSFAYFSLLFPKGAKQETEKEVFLMENDEKIRRLAVSILAAVEQDRRAGGNKADAAKQWLAGPRALFWARVACGRKKLPVGSVEE